MLSSGRLVLCLLAALLPACGDGTTQAVHLSKPAAGELHGEGWIGGGPVRLQGPHSDLRVVLFFHPDCPRCLTEARRLGALASRVTIVGATRSRDREAVRAFQSKAEASWPVVYGLEQGVAEHFRAQALPSVRVIDPTGRVVGRDLIALRAMLP